MSVSLHLLGTPHIEQAGQPVHVDTRKAIALIAYLVARGGYQSRDTLSALLWEGNDQVAARGALRRTLSVLKTALDGEGLLIEREAIAFDPTRIDCDLTAFNNALAACETHGHSSHEACPLCAVPLNEAVANYHGDFLQGFTLRDSAEFDLWQFQQTEHLRRTYADALEKLAHLYSDAQQYLRAIELTQTRLSLDPLHETAHRQLIQLYTWTGQRSLALRQYHECVRVLEQELDVAPLDETTQLYRQVMENTLEPRRISVVPPAAGRDSGSELEPPPLIGRGREIAQMEQIYREIAIAAQPGLLIVEGEAGVGKTRLVDYFARRCQSLNQPVIRLRCFESEISIAYAPLIHTLREEITTGRLHELAPHWLGELARLLPEVQTMSPDIPLFSGDAATAQSRLYEAVCQAFFLLLRGETPGILLFEDVQWADTATLDLLAYWLRRLSTGILTILTWRSEEVPPPHQLRVLLVDYSRIGGHLTRIHLARLSRGDVEQWVRMSLSHANSLMADRVFTESEGLPLFVQEYLALLRLNPDLQQESEWRVPLEIHDLLRSRVAQVSDIARQILDTGAVIGRSFDLEMVQECSGRDESEAVDAADELERRGLLRDVDASTMMYEFIHEKLRTIVYRDMSLARRRLLHRRAAKIILSRVGQTDKIRARAALIAAHFHAGGQDVEAADFYTQAGHHARGLYANREALHYFEQALALGYLRPAELYAPIGDLHTILGDYRAAIRSYESGKAYAAAGQSPAFEQKLGQVYHRLGEWELADSYYQEGFAALPDGAFTERASFLTDRSLTKVATGDLTAALDLAQAALEMAEETTNARVKAQAHNMMGLLARKRDQFDLAARHLYTSLSFVESLNDEGMYAAVLNNLGLLHMETHQYGEAQRLFEAALEKCRLLGDLHREAALHNNLADLFHALEMSEEALKHLKLAVSLFVKVGQQDTEIRAETWKLTEW